MIRLRGEGAWACTADETHSAKAATARSLFILFPPEIGIIAVVFSRFVFQGLFFQVSFVQGLA
jgi:hypothetical protein